MKRLLLLCLLLNGCQLPSPVTAHGAITVRLQPQAFHALAAAKQPGDVNHVTFKLYSRPDNTLQATYQLAGSGTGATFSGVPDGTYYATVEAFDSSDDSDSITQGGPQTTTNTVTVASPAVTYSSGTALVASLPLLDGTGGEPAVTVTTGLSPGAYHGWLLDGNGQLHPSAPYVSPTAGFHFFQVPDGTFQAVASLALSSTTSTPSHLSTERLTFANGVGSPGNSYTISIPGQIQSSASSSNGLGNPQCVAVSGSDLLIADAAKHCIYKLSGGTVTVIAGQEGSRGFGGDGGAATAASLDTPNAVAVGADGTIFIADTGNKRIRQIRNGTITTIAGNGTSGASGDGGSATEAQLSNVTALAVTSVSPLNLYLADSDNNRLRQINDATISTVSGSTSLSNPSGLAVAADGTLYIADTGHHIVCKLQGSTLTTVAGISGTSGMSGDGGAATSATLNGPTGLAFGPAGDLIIADTGNHRIRRIEGTTITLVSGSSPGFAGDGGAATDAQLNLPVGLAVTPTGDLYISDSGNSRVRLIH